MAADDGALGAINIAYASILVLIFAVVPFFGAIFSQQSGATKYVVSEAQYKWLKWTSPIVASTFILESILYHLQSRLHRGYSPSSDTIRYGLGSTIAWSAISILLLESNEPAWWRYIVAWILVAICDAIQLVRGSGGAHAARPWGKAHATIQFLRLFVAITTAMYAIAALKRRKAEKFAADEETQSLLRSSTSTLPGQTSSAYGASPYRDNEPDDGKDSDDEDVSRSDDEDMNEDDKEEERIKAISQKRLAETGLLRYLRGFTIFLPHLIPYKDRFTQFWLLVLLLCTCIDRVTTLLIPLQLAKIIDALTAYQGTGQVPFKELGIYVLLKFPASIIIDILETAALTRISQFSKYQLNSLAFSHVMSLSMDYHTSRSTGQVITAIEQGTNLSFFMDIVLGLGPRVADLLIAAVFLTKKFDSSTGAVMLMATLINGYVTAKGTKIEAAIERKYVNTEQEENKVLYDAISNWYTVEIHNRRSYEHERYNKAVMKNLLSMRRYSDINQLVYSMQSAVLKIGYIIVCYIIATRVADGTSTVSSFVFMTSYWSSISGPMMALAYQFRDTSSQLVKAEWLYQLLQTKPSVQDQDGAQPLRITNCEIEFKDVAFGYGPERQIIHDVSFKVAPGQSIALVGETGSGKSTILKLLYRFYDVTKGSITIDGQDLRNITLNSLRESLGAVPQDPSVFDQTIMENLLYARPFATEQDVFEACRLAHIHDQIMSFPDGYRSRIGERGVRLSGGELQRLAIARVLIRRPRIVVLDEATSAVDSETEASVQQAIQALSDGRTVFTIAHRLSTVVAADRILVVHKGEIVESGTHRELLERDGRYANLWKIQTAANNPIIM